MHIGKVLIVDDEDLILLSTRLLLQQHGFEVHCSPDGKDIIATIENVQPDLILLDLIMPDIDGWEVLRTIKEHPGTNTLPVILFTAGEFTATPYDIERWDVSGLIRKPFNLKELLAMINALQEDDANA